MKRQKETIGAIVEINVYDEYYCYAQILALGNLAFIDYRTKEHLEDFPALKASVSFFQEPNSRTISSMFTLGMFQNISMV